MIQYKLIQEYPGHSLGEIHTADKGTKWYGTIFYNANPKFWQKVEEVDYEILTVTPSEKNLNNTNKEAVITFKMCNKDLQMCNIHSVKRLSDGEVFTIGDEYSNNHAGLYTEESIHNIKIVDGECRIYDGQDSGYYPIKYITKLPKKTPLFTTEDGVEIFDKKTSYYLVSNDFKVCFSSWFSQADLPFKTFSTKEKAEEYILMNKPCLSIKEITDLVLNNPNRRISDCAELAIINSFKQLAKSKL